MDRVLTMPTMDEVAHFGDRTGINGTVCATLWAADGNLKQRVINHNLVSQVGDQYFGERATGIASPPGAVTGMRLGKGVTTPSKTGAGAAIVTYVTASQVAIDGGYPTSTLSGASRRITFMVSWAAGVATTTAIAEAVITNESPLTNVAGTAANTIARALLSPTVDKGASDTLVITWVIDLLGA